MKSIFAFALVAGIMTGVTIATTVAAEANPRYKGRVNNRQSRQQLRINQGIGNDSLTKRETGRLQQQQQHINNMEQRMRASGNGLTAKEHFALEQAQDRASKNIYKQKHDNQERGD